MIRSEHRRGGILLSVAETGEGRPFIFQHGLCGDAGQTMQVFPPDAGHRCLTLECRGHGLSEAGSPEGFSLAVFADDIADLIASRRLGRVVVGGISMGAALALRLAVRRPDLVGALVLARPAWLTEAAPDNLAPNALVGELLETFPAAEAAKRFEETETVRILAREAPDNLKSLRGFFSRRPMGVTAALLRRIAADGPGVSEAEIRALAVPALVIGTQQDFVHPFSYARTLAGWIAGAALVELTPKGEDATAYQTGCRAALRDFLGTCGVGARPAPP